MINCWDTDPDNRRSFTELCSVMDTALHTMSDYLDLNMIANTPFSNSSVEENPYVIADNSGDI